MFGKMAEMPAGDESLESRPFIDGFLLWAQSELRFRPETLQKYRSTLIQVERSLPPGKRLEAFSKEDFWRYRAGLVARGVSDSWTYTTTMIIRRFLQYAKEELGCECLDWMSIQIPKRRRKDVAFLTLDEVDRLVGSIKLSNADGTEKVAGLRFRAMVEMLLGSALRISELLSLNRGQIDPKTRECRIQGKGGRERTAFFTARALLWCERYVAARKDDHEALFVDCFGRARMKRADIWRVFARHKRLAGIAKPLHPHILRHTAATQMLFNGCPIGHIKEILGHARLETTCRYYLGVDHRAAKSAHEQFLKF